MDALLKSTICEKKKLPYGRSETVTYYNPGCVDGVYVCRDICGKKCKKLYKENSDCGGCARGHLPDDLLFCPSRVTDVRLEYLSYGLVVDKFIKEGKKAYKKMQQIKEEMSIESFLERFTNDFDNFSKHKVEAWFLNTLKNFASNPKNQAPNSILSVSDFAQNLKLSRKHETSEEYFHKTQIALFGTVSSVSGETQHSLSQITSSDCK